jgi:hypothetical protein
MEKKFVGEVGQLRVIRRQFESSSCSCPPKQKNKIEIRFWFDFWRFWTNEEVITKRVAASPIFGRGDFFWRDSRAFFQKSSYKATRHRQSWLWTKTHSTEGTVFYPYCLRHRKASEGERALTYPPSFRRSSLVPANLVQTGTGSLEGAVFRTSAFASLLAFDCSLTFCDILLDGGRALIAELFYCNPAVKTFQWIKTWADLLAKGFGSGGNKERPLAIKEVGFRIVQIIVNQYRKTEEIEINSWKTSDK